MRFDAVTILSLGYGEINVRCMMAVTFCFFPWQWKIHNMNSKLHNTHSTIYHINVTNILGTLNTSYLKAACKNYLSNPSHSKSHSYFLIAMICSNLSLKCYLFTACHKTYILITKQCWTTKLNNNFNYKICANIARLYILLSLSNVAHIHI